MNKKKIDKFLKAEVDNEKIKKVVLYLRLFSSAIYNTYAEYLHT